MIGLDGLDSILLSKFEADLPNLRKLKQQGPKVKLISVYPPDTPTAWASIYTGLNPAKHGIVQFVDPLEKATTMLSSDVDNSAIRGRTFWDLASRSGGKVCILFPYLGYPPWPVNGVMVSRSAITEDVQTFPSSISKEHLSYLNTTNWTPGRRSYEKFIQVIRQLVKDEFNFGLRMLREDNWSLFFLYSSSPDKMGHLFWRFCDENDPSYPGPNPYQEVIRDLYHLYDEKIGEFMAALDSETSVIVFSDHGHGMRPPKLININEVLKRAGFLNPKAKNLPGRGLGYLLEKLKRSSVQFISKYELAELGVKLLKLFPRGRRLYTSPLSIDWSSTVAHLSDLSGIKSYSYGGIMVNKARLIDTEYEELRSQLIQEIGQVEEPESGDKVVKWICRREDLYSGEYINKYPDVIFLLRNDYGAGWDIFRPVFSTTHTHNLQPGSHRIDTPVFFATNLNRAEVKIDKITLMDIAPTVLALLGCETTSDSDGQDIFLSP